MIKIMDVWIAFTCGVFLGGVLGMSLICLLILILRK